MDLCLYFCIVLLNTLCCSVGPADLTVGTLSRLHWWQFWHHPKTPIPTVTDNLFAQGLISQNLIAVSFEPSVSIPATNGELTFGGVDASKFVGDLTYL
jgi:cathepsin E